jgi:hypothetical protein
MILPIPPHCLKVLTMKKILSISLGAAALGLAFGSVAAVNNQLSGSDTLEVVTQSVIAGGSVVSGGVTYTAPVCAGVSPLVYIGGGSSRGEGFMVDTSIVDDVISPAQVTAPMSRALAANVACKAANPTLAENFLVGLDGLAVVSKETNVQCAGGVAFTGGIAVQDLNGVAGLDCPGCTSGTYNFSNEFDVLRVLFAGMHNNGSNAIANQNCNSDVRHTLASSWDNIHEGTCATGECTRLEHAWRRDDLSGTTDTFLGLLGLPGIGNKPFCNGTGMEDKDPIRRSCVAADQTCRADGTSGLVLPIFTPDFAPGQEGNAYISASCVVGKFDLAEATAIDLGNGAIKRDCAELENFSIAGFCLAPQAADNTFNCISPKNNPNVFFPNLNDDARIFNKWVRLANGTLTKDRRGTFQTNGWHRMRQACKEESSTLNIGCLAGEVACSWGFAGREADEAVATAKALPIKAVPLTEANVRKFLVSPAPADKYPLARGLYFNTLIGFENLAASTVTGAANEAALATCFKSRASADYGVAKGGFYTLGVDPSCLDFNETGCNSVNITCDRDTDCGSNGVCVGGNTGTTGTLEGTCSLNCTTNADCKGGRTCVPVGTPAVNKCQFASNVNACSNN